MKRNRAPAPAIAFERWIVWEDDLLVAVNKPAGILSQGGEGGAGVNLVDLAREHYGRGGIGVLHRIDRNVSGVVLLAKDPRAARSVSLQIQRGAVERIYRAVVRGEPPSDRFVVDVALYKDPRANEVRAATPAQLAALDASLRAEFRAAKTEVSVLARFASALGPIADLEVRPVTGRSHQIRAHLAHVHLPIVGDPKYGVGARGIVRPLLHATQIGFEHPRTRAHIEIRADLPWTTQTLRRLAPAR